MYDATVRFANAQSYIFPDPKKDVRACSIAIHVPAGVLGPHAMRQDFSMNNARVFPLNDAHDFAITTVVVTAPSMLRGWLSLEFRDKMGFLRTAVIGAKQTKAATWWWTRTACSCGPRAV